MVRGGSAAVRRLQAKNQAIKQILMLAGPIWIEHRSVIYGKRSSPFLGLGTNYNFYGSATATGQIERRGKWRLCWHPQLYKRHHHASKSDDFDPLHPAGPNFRFLSASSFFLPILPTEKFFGLAPF